MQINYRVIISLVLSVITINVKAQEADTVYKVFSVENIFDLAIKNSQQLKVSRSAVEISEQRAAVAKLQRLPTASAAVTAGYLGDILLIDKDFSNTTNVAMPHFANTFGVQASQLIFKGNAVNNSIDAATLQEQVAMLGFEKNRQNTKLLVAGHYFDLYGFYLQRDVYNQNIKLAELRLKNINANYHQGMVTRNDVIRTELQIANLKLAVVVINNNIAIVNKQLTIITGLPELTYIMPDTTLLDQIPKTAGENLNYYNEQGLLNVPDIKAAETASKIGEKNLAITKADRLPVLSAYAQNNVQRPVTSRSPALDMYSNGWQAGLSLSYNIASLYTAPKQIKLARLQVAQLKQAEVVERQTANVAINAAFIKNKQAYVQWQTQQTNISLATENYRIIEKKYLNQLALIIDMLDATNAKLDAELQYSNAKINILYTKYQLYQAAGLL